LSFILHIIKGCAAIKLLLLTFCQNPWNGMKQQDADVGKEVCTQLNTSSALTSTKYTRRIGGAQVIN
jgi:hypothetical protein